MGYTHYWTQQRDIPEKDWQRITADVSKILAATNVPLAWEFDEPKRPSQVDAEAIRFNGLDDDGHETFMISRLLEKNGEKWMFCKTAAKPYDVVVTAILAYLATQYPSTFQVTSDGEREDWRRGIDLAKDATDRPITFPKGM